MIKVTLPKDLLTCKNYKVNEYSKLFFIWRKRKNMQRDSVFMTRGVILCFLFILLVIPITSIFIGYETVNDKVCSYRIMNISTWFIVFGIVNVASMLVGVFILIGMWLIYPLSFSNRKILNIWFTIITTIICIFTLIWMILGCIILIQNSQCQENHNEVIYMSAIHLIIVVISQLCLPSGKCCLCNGSRYSII